MDSVLLIGNGPNRLSAKGPSWTELLTELGNAVGGEGEPLDTSTPFPLLYEQIFLRTVRAQMGIGDSDAELFIKEKIADLFSTVEPDEVHHALMELPFEHVLTTNYDHALEMARPQHQREQAGKDEPDDYNLHRKFLLGEKTLWHIHGDCDSPVSITIGYEQYSRHLQRMRDHAISRVLPDLRNQVESDTSWVDFFFHKNVYILGLELDFVEFHLWWLLTYRARLKPKSEIQLRNHIYYLFPESMAEDPEQAAKRSMLEAFQVDLKPVPDGGAPGNPDWSEFYRSAVDCLGKVLAPEKQPEG